MRELRRHAHRQRQIVALMCERAYTLSEAAERLEMSADSVAHVLRRLPTLLEVQELDDDVEPRYRVLFPAGRVCAAPGCPTILRRSSAGDYCEIHGGVTAASRLPALPRPRFDGKRLRARRQQQGLTVEQLAARADMDPAFLERLEGGSSFIITVDLERSILRALAKAALAGVAAGAPRRRRR